VVSLLRPLFVERGPLPRLAAWPAYRWLVVGTVCLGAFLGQLDASIAGLVLPTLEGAFNAPVASVEWVAIAYLLTLAALVVPLGRLADLLGRKMLYTWGFLVFIAGSALCGFAPSLGWLIAFRVMQAFGAAMLQANSVAIITAAVPLLGWFVLPCTSRAAVAEAAAEPERFDWVGAALLGPVVALLLLGLTFGNTWGWASLTLALTLSLGVVCLIMFWIAEKRSTSPPISNVSWTRARPRPVCC
jgi:MFS family permease